MLDNISERCDIESIPCTLAQELTEMPNCEVKVFNPIHSNLITMFGDIRKVIASNHDKLFIIDGQYSMIGGRNISKDYFVDADDHPESYRDCDIVVNSREVANQLTAAFDEEFTRLKTYTIGKELFGNIDIMSSDLFAAHDTMFSHLLNERAKQPSDADKYYIKSAEEIQTELRLTVFGSTT